MGAEIELLVLVLNPVDCVQINTWNRLTVRKRMSNVERNNNCYIALLVTTLPSVIK